MQLHALLFGSSSRYERMAAVLARSAGNTPHLMTIHRITDTDDDLRPMARDSCKQTWVNNARKAKHHCQIINSAEDGELLGMIDADTMILGDLSEIESMEFDIAYTVRPPKSKWKLNTGVYFVRVSERMKKFCREWYAMVCEMLSNEKLHLEWKNERKYGGIHQAAFGWMIENSGVDFSALALPCEIWNCVNGCYATAENPKIVHLMEGTMRHWCLDGAKAENANAQRLADKWRAYEMQEAAA